MEQAEKIKNEIFNLMILGEAKSGKSTFINAYLGKEVVPMDVLQCTSAIVKIRRGNNFELVAKTAGGGKSVITGYDKIRDFLKSHASIADRYRNIPVTTINNEMLIKYKGKSIPSRVMEDFLTNVKNDNSFDMDDSEYRRLIREYIDQNAKDWGKIITEMEISYPLPEEMQGITIIDSPGVGAAGNVGIIAEEYMKEANAIIFVKSLYGQALESSSFLNFMRTTCKERQKGLLFLVFTGKSILQGSEFNRLREQAVEMYKNDIDPEKIIFVDSKMQLFLNRCKELGTEEKIDEFFDRLEAEGDDFSPASNCWLRSKRDVTRFTEKMEEQSNFRNVHAALEKFARVANYIQLILFLENMEKEYSRYKTIFLETLKVARENVDDPNALEDHIIQKQNEIRDTYIKISEGVTRIYRKYTDNINGEGIIMKEAELKRKSYEDQLENFRKLPESQIDEKTFSNMKGMTMDAVEDTKDFRREMADSIIEECNRELIQYTDDSTKIPAEAYIPNFTETDFESIDRAAKEKTSGYDLVESGFTFLKTTEKVPYHHLKDHVKLVAESIHERLDTEIIPEMMNNVVDYADKCREVYTTKLTEHKDELECEYVKLLEDKESNEKRMAKVIELEQKVRYIEEELVKINELKGDLNNHVEQ